LTLSEHSIPFLKTKSKQSKQIEKKTKKRNVVVLVFSNNQKIKNQTISNDFEIQHENGRDNRVIRLCLLVLNIFIEEHGCEHD